MDVKRSAVYKMKSEVIKGHHTAERVGIVEDDAPLKLGFKVTCCVTPKKNVSCISCGVKFVKTFGVALHVLL